MVLAAAYGDKAPTRSNIVRLYGRFREGREDVQDEPGMVAPLSVERTAISKRLASVAATLSLVISDDSE
jgi:hypothetical protein